MSAAEFPIGKIVVGKRLRDADPDLVEAYKQSILEREARGQRGLIQPIELCAHASKKGHGELVDGLHRLAAYKALGRDTIPADMHPAMEPVERQLAEIDAQILHAGLAPIDKAEFLARRKALYEELYPETRHGATGRRGKEGIIPSFSRAAADKLGCSPSAVSKSVYIAEHLTPEAEAVFKATPNARKFAEVYALAKLEPKLQLKVAKRIADPDAPEKTVSAARSWADGAAAPTAAQKAHNAAVAAWQKMGARERGQFLTFLSNEDLPKGWSLRKAAR